MRKNAWVSPRNYLRVRGEYWESHLGVNRSMELPPRARRIHSDGMIFLRFFGTTSACAENTLKSAIQNSSSRNYLRVRGEYRQELLAGRALLELPPRARRIPERGKKFLPDTGTTSACAENTRVWCGFPP